MRNRKKPDPMFDGHRVFDLAQLSTVDKLRYLSMQIELRHYVRSRVRRIDPGCSGTESSKTNKIGRKN